MPGLQLNALKNVFLVKTVLLEYPFEVFQISCFNRRTFTSLLYNLGYVMNYLIKRSSQAVLFSLFSLNIAIADDGPVAEIKLFFDAFNKQDAATVASLFHVDGKLLPAGEPIVTGTEAIQAYWQGAYDAGLSQIEKTPIEFIVSGELAVETSSYIVTFNETKIAGKDTLVWRKNSVGQWKISTDIRAGDE